MTDRKKVRIVSDGPMANQCHLYILGDDGGQTELTNNITGLTITARADGLITATFDLYDIELDLIAELDASDGEPEEVERNEKA